MISIWLHFLNRRFSYFMALLRDFRPRMQGFVPNLPVLHETSLRNSLDLLLTIQLLAGYSQGLSLQHNR